MALMEIMYGNVGRKGIEEDLSLARMYSDLAGMGIIGEDEAAGRIRDIVFRELDAMGDATPRR